MLKLFTIYSNKTLMIIFIAKIIKNTTKLVFEVLAYSLLFFKTRVSQREFFKMFSFSFSIWITTDPFSFAENIKAF